MYLVPWYLVHGAFTVPSNHTAPSTLHTEKTYKYKSNCIRIPSLDRGWGCTVTEIIQLYLDPPSSPHVPCSMFHFPCAMALLVWCSDAKKLKTKKATGYIFIFIALYVLFQRVVPYSMAYLLASLGSRMKNKKHTHTKKPSGYIFISFLYVALTHKIDWPGLPNDCPIR
mmetsp:Transcript_118255/g.232180  ORF Transcript_118255/g.232180 Transcript_118255/m.232180 type:complete len:169 (-) Transcript_118255:239-745(-)